MLHHSPSQWERRDFREVYKFEIRQRGKVEWVMTKSSSQRKRGNSRGSSIESEQQWSISFFSLEMWPYEYNCEKLQINSDHIINRQSAMEWAVRYTYNNKNYLPTNDNIIARIIVTVQTVKVAYLIEFEYQSASEDWWCRRRRILVLYIEKSYKS